MARTIVERAAVAGRRLPMTYEAWRAWAVEGTKSEWVDGEVVVFMPTTARQWHLLGFLATLLTAYVRFRDLGILLGDSVEMRLAGSGRVPDILFVRTANLDRVSETRVDGPADLVVEIVSADSAERDHEEKKAEYAAAGVPEYWVVESRPGRRGAAFYRLVAGAYEPMLVDGAGRLWSTVVEGFWLKPAWLDNEPPPDALDCLFVIAPEMLAAKLRAAEAGVADPAAHAASASVPDRTRR